MASVPETTRKRQRRSIGFERARIAPMLSGEQLAEMFALADFQIPCGGSLQFSKPSPLAISLIEFGLVERVRQRELGRGSYLHRLTDLGWLTLLTRAETEMKHILPPEEVADVE